MHKTILSRIVPACWTPQSSPFGKLLWVAEYFTHNNRQAGFHHRAKIVSCEPGMSVIMDFWSIRRATSEMWRLSLYSLPWPFLSALMSGATEPLILLELCSDSCLPAITYRWWVMSQRQASCPEKCHLQWAGEPGDSSGWGLNLPSVHWSCSWCKKRTNKLPLSCKWLAEGSRIALCHE